jgi:hypothetical protein
MKQTITESIFIDGINSARPDNFSYHGLKALFEFLASLNDDCGTESEYDPIGICCEFTEYANVIEYAKDHTIDLDICPSCGEGLSCIEDLSKPTCDDCGQDFSAEIFEEISNKTSFVSIDKNSGFDDSFIIQQF